jgi:hypothetical protein
LPGVPGNAKNTEIDENWKKHFRNATDADTVDIFDQRMLDGKKEEEKKEEEEELSEILNNVPKEVMEG